MPPRRIGVQTLSFRRPLRRAVEAAGRVGADGVAIDLRHELPYEELSQTAVRHLRKLLDDHRLAVAAATFPLRRGLADPTDLPRRVAAVMGAMTAASRLGARVLIAPLGPLPVGGAEADDPKEAAAGDRLTETLTAIGAYGDRVGARLAIATGSESGERLAELLSPLPEGVLGVGLDPAGLLTAGHDPQAAARTLGPRLLHAYANDAVRDLAAGGGAVRTPLGRGGVDFPGLLGVLEEHGYSGWITVEGAGSPDPEAELGDAVAYLRALQQDG